ncbi:MAG: NAD-dependent epimerase/dehydratase family protein [Chloroflexi bacterium]|nr:NAD-dependent epimerase/dehydratase family protein [Chloroflexota bacterium]MCI0579092.1 NAD-dependent epimerase/dehydratase family protein [Chloroflexota bacterium]MCI0650086.1 NAD-dependent epimerase/dehydratase family protein [Chloroflexota bacterium]MCI0728288.1 NAD-dependent epimerase/dehydratase family protein [Chloroflexota bacterium]
MRALVTGGTGFIGANLVAGLNERGITARVLRRPSSSVAALEGLAYEEALGDVLDEPAVLAEAMAGCDWVFHVAAVSDYWRQGQEWLYRVNVEGTKNVLAAAQAVRVKRLVFTSSLAAMGLPAPGRLLDESNEFNLRPEQFPYGHSKHLAEIEVRLAAMAGLAAVIVNPSVVLGPRDVNQISGSLVIEAARGRLRFFPPGGVNFVAVEDVVVGHIAAAERGRVAERYILAGENLTHRQAITMMCEVVGQRPPFLAIPGWVLPPASLAVAMARRVVGNRVVLDANQVRLAGMAIYADSRKAREELDLPQTSFKVAVQQAFDWYNSHGYLARD